MASIGRGANVVSVAPVVVRQAALIGVAGIVIGLTALVYPPGVIIRVVMVGNRRQVVTARNASVLLLLVMVLVLVVLLLILLLQGLVLRMRGCNLAAGGVRVV